MSMLHARWATSSVWVRRAIKVTVLGAFLFLAVQVVYAAGDDQKLALGQTPSTLAWIKLIDGEGLNAWQYELAIKTDHGVDVGKGIPALLVTIAWQLYVQIVMPALWFLHWVLSFEWLTLITAPLMDVGNALRAVFNKLGLASIFLAVAGLVTGVHLLRGRYSKAVYEVVAGGVVLGLAATVFANPVAAVMGLNGISDQVHERTMEFATALENEIEVRAPGTTSSGGGDPVTTAMISTFIRKPVQIVSFGEILDGGSCEGAWKEKVSQGPWGYTAHIRDAVRSCNEALGTYADTPTMGMVGAAIILIPAAVIILILGVILGGVVMLAMVNVAIASVRLVIDLVFALLPGGSRDTLAQRLADIAINLVVFIFSVLFLELFLLVVRRVFGTGTDPMQSFMIANVLLVVGLVAYLRYRKKLATSAGRLSSLLSKRPSGGGGGKPAGVGLAGAGASGGAGAGQGGVVPVVKRVVTHPKVKQVAGKTARIGAGILVAPARPVIKVAGKIRRRKPKK